MTKGFLNYIMTRGVTKSKDNGDDLIVFLNIVCFLSCIGVVINGATNLFFFGDLIYFGISFHIFLTFFGVIALHHFGKYKAAKMFFSIGVSIWVFFSNILTGGFFCQSLVIGTCIAVTFLLFKKEEAKLGRNLILFSIISFVGSMVYGYFFEPVFGFVDYKGDEIGVFILCLAWLSIIFYTYESRKIKLIKSLKTSNKDLLNKTQELEKFTYIASHDLKSPLGNIINFLNLIETDLEEKNYENIKSFLYFSQAGAHQMNELIEAVLELTQVNQAKPRENKEVNLNLVLNKAIKNCQKEIRAKGAKIESCDLPIIFGSDMDILVVFQNLIKNAFHYNLSKHPKLVINSESHDDKIIITFRDNGIGIKEKYHEQIFEYFKRLHNKSDFSGTGIGLGLCRKIMDRYDGTITVNSEHGIYSEFVLSFPKTHSYSERSIVSEPKPMKST